MSQPAPILTDPHALRELDAKVLEALGARRRMTVYQWADRKQRKHPSVAFVEVPTGSRCTFARRLYSSMVDGATGERITDGFKALPYSSDWSAIRLVEDEIERRGLGERYIVALIGQLDPRYVGWTGPFDAADIWEQWRASCEARCRAALAVCEDTP